MKNRNWFWGIFFLFAAVFVVACQLGSFGHIGFFSIAATILLAAIIIQSVTHRNFFGFFISLAFLYMIYWQPLKLVEISPWLLLLAGALAGMGFSFLFGQHPHQMHCSNGSAKYFSDTTENIDDNSPYAKVSMGASCKYLHSDCLKSGHFVCSMGELQIYFDQTQLSPDGAEIFLECNLGSIELYIPKEWKVVNNLYVNLGDVEFDPTSQPAPDAPRLTLSGKVNLGDVELHFI